MPKPQSSDGGDDARFRTMHSAPTFNTSRKESKKVKLDGRFEGVLTESRFRVAPGSVDRYGRKTRKTGQASKDLEQFYEIDRDDPNIHDKNMDKDKSLKKQSNEDRMDYLNRLSRGELQESDSESSSDSSQEDESDSDNSSDVNLDSNERETAKQSVLDIPQEEEEVPTGDSTTRLAILHCDWDNIKSDDLLVVLQSFCPTNGSILSVTVYPSDYGIEQMAQEEKFGPQGIWTNADKDTNAENHSSDPSNSDGNSCEEDDVSESKSGSIDESESEQDVYDNVVGDLESAEESKAHGENDTQSLRKLSKGADFERKGNTAGLIMQDELVRRGKANPNTLLDETPTSDADGLNVIALRDYELSKLRYYFAIAVLDSVATSEALYEALDGVELEHSSMTFDLRFVPEDADFTARTVRDHCTGAAISVYTPPDFIVNALQHTNVKCTWDEGDTARARKLGGTLAQWKDLAESDIQQFLASESENESDGEHDTHETKRKDNKSIRKLLLGQNDEDSNADSDIENDDFFRRDDDAAASKDASSDNENDENKVYTYFSKDKSSKADEPKKDETPFEALQRKMAEKKKARKQAKKDLKAQSSGLDKSAIAATILKKLQSTDKKKNSSVTNPKAVGSAELELMFDTQDENDYNMRSVQKEEKLRKKQLEKGSKKKRGRTSGEAEAPDQATFKVDLKDNRFNRLIAGDSHFGIDPMSSDFKETQGMRDILAAQRKRRKHALSANPSAASETSSSVLDIAALKNKFQAKSKK